MELPELEKLKVPRCLIPEGFGVVTHRQLHHFGDALEDAYGVVSYLRIENAVKKVHCALVMAKSRLAPIHQITVPRLRLCAAVTAVRMDSLLRGKLRMSLEESVFWTDSTTILHYIWSKTKRFQTFVANRLAIIHDGSNPSQWRYVSSKDNPADDASRGLTAKTMLERRRWHEGPKFMWRNQHSWPLVPVYSPTMLDSDSEIVATEKAIIAYIQKINYASEIQCLKLGKPITKKSCLYSLEPFYDADGLLKIKGRLERAPIADAAKHPVIIPRDHHIAELLVRNVYVWESHHCGREFVMAMLRQKYWIPRARPLMKRILRGCVVCRHLKGVLQKQRMADLPVDRVTPQCTPFTYTGVDCFGPYFVKRGRSQEKRYGCLFTCLTMRAIRIEKLHSMDGDSFINALIRFIARRGKPKKIRSDNGSNFVGGNKELRESIKKRNDSNSTRQELLMREIEWEFNPPTASHMGGVWEREIRTVRSILVSLLRNQVLDDERLDTIFAEVENVVNSRPLTVVSDDSRDAPALTPNDLLRPGEGHMSPSDVVIYVGRANTIRRRRVALGIDADITDLTDNIQKMFTLGKDEDVILYVQKDASGNIGKKVPAVGDLKEYAGQTIVFHVNQQGQFHPPT
ncbi:uncharacterized protein [Ptychodera flava]|uniref:uncharacterized protein n=1 Tax=Ptychodera flava TaxID=63121 RepID=UPI00396A57F8